MHSRTRRTHTDTSDTRTVLGEFHLRGQNSRLAPLRLRWTSAESLYYGGRLEVLGGPTGMQTRFARRMEDPSWLKNDPNRIAGGRPFTESYFTTVAVLMAFAEAERLIMETVRSPVPMTSTIQRAQGPQYSDLDDFDRNASDDGEPRPYPGSLRAG